ncbi:MAG: hypothetical protein GX160_09810 [Clostridiales bacterium]|jgi:hypothetical protein|nr:hypothetical protein [Clostridiales bacterium]
MLDNILDQRILRDGLYDITLTLHEDEYFAAYDHISQENAKEIVKNYLVRRQDDGRPENIKIKHNKNQRIVTIEANLYYTGNEKTTYSPRSHDYINN